MSTKADIEQEIRNAMKPAIEELETLKQELAAFDENKQAVIEEIELRKKKHHSGKWNQQSKQWSCCADSQVLSPGCRPL
jgi:hypothetical protein